MSVVTVILASGHLLTCDLTAAGQLQHCVDRAPPPHWELIGPLDSMIVSSPPDKLPDTCKPGDQIIANFNRWTCKP